eukprot:gene10400-13969_t
MFAILVLFSFFHIISIKSFTIPFKSDSVTDYIIPKPCTTIRRNIPKLCTGTDNHPIKSEMNHIKSTKQHIFSRTIKKLPNILTLGRVAAIPLLVYFSATNKNSIAFFTFVVACITDFIDGYLARKLNVTSTFGAFLDPVADKLMVAAGLTVLATKIPSFWYSIPMSIILCREIGVSALREWMAEIGKRDMVKVSNLGKLKTTIQMISLSLLLLSVPGLSADFDLCAIWNIPKPFIFSIGMFSLYICTLLTAISGGEYIFAAWPYITKKDD